MMGYQEEAEAEMWDAIAAQDHERSSRERQEDAGRAAALEELPGSVTGGRGLLAIAEAELERSSSGNRAYWLGFRAACLEHVRGGVA